MLRTISTDELNRLVQKGGSFVIVNVLERSSFENEHICGSINIPGGDIEKEAPKLINKSEQVIVHCSGPMCTASESAGEKLSSMGYKNVRRFEGGIEEWKKAGHCLEGKAVKKAA